MLGSIYRVGVFRYTLGIPRYQTVLSSLIFCIVYLVREPNSADTDIYGILTLPPINRKVT
jgi:hypothetical protein